jgi:hypothetical protein
VLKATTTDSARGGDTQELELGLKWAFHRDLERSLLLGAGAEVELPLDQPEESEVPIPYLSFAKGAGDLTWQGTLRTHLPFHGIDQGDAEVSAVVHWLYSVWPRRPFPGLEAAGDSSQRQRRP